MWQKTIFASAALLAMSVSVLAQDKNGFTPNALSDQQAYCEYVTQQAAAQSDLLRTPSAVGGVTQPNTGLPMQLVWGLSSSVSDIRKAGLTMDAARKNCQLYNATTAAQQSIQYALPALEKETLQHRLDLIQQASVKLDDLMTSANKMVAAQDLTRPMFFSLQTTKIKLDADQADTQTKIAALYAPDLSEKPLKELVAEKQAGEVAEQNAIEKLNRQSNWDIALSIGAHHQIKPLVENSGAYGAVTVSYNLGSHAIDKHLDEAAHAYAAWKSVQENDVARNAQVLKKQVTEALTAQTARLKSLQNQENQIEGSLQLVATAETSAALDFRNQLISAQLLLGIEIGDAKYRVNRLQEFLSNNY